MSIERCRDWRSESRSGFTLVELLVVIGIIGVLISILLPTLGRVRRIANMTACKSNLAQVGVATRMYANDNKDHYPDQYALGGAFYRRGYLELNPSDPTSVPETYGMPALYALFGYIKGQSKVWICPAAADSMQSNKNTYVWTLLSASLANQTSGPRGKQKNRDVFWVYDNFANLPYPSGIRRGTSDPNPTLNSINWLFPHNYYGRITNGVADGNGNARRGAINMLFQDGSIGIVVYVNNPNPAPPATPQTAPPKTIIVHGE